MAGTNKKFSELDSASALSNGDLIALAQVDSGAETGYTSRKTTVGALANKIATDNEFTTALSRFSDKTLTGAINENLDNILDLLPIDEASGAIANFVTDLAMPLIEVRLSIVAKETGTGTKSPSNPYIISGFSTSNLKRSGKNVLNPNDCALENYYEVNSDGTIHVLASNANAWNTLPEIPIKAGTYKVTRTLSTGRITIRTALSNYESNACNINEGQTTGNLTITEDTNFRIKIMTSNSTYPVDVGLMIEVGSEASDFEAYTATQTTLALGQTVYGGYVVQDKDGHRQFDDTYSGLVNLSDLTFNPTTKGGHTCFYADLPNGVIKSGGEQAFFGKCSTYTVTSNLILPNDLTCLFYCSELYGGYTRIIIRDDSASAMTGAQFTAYVTGQIVYEKANPQTVALPDGAPIIAFNGVNNVWNDTNGDTTVKYKLGIQAYIDKKIAEVQALVL